jgi:predicted DNA-binding protein (MmcQ/YjbR family)
LNKEEIFEYIKKQYNTTPEYLWKKYPLYAVFKHNNNKWYGIIMNVDSEKLGLLEKKEVDILNVKCPPEMIGAFRQQKGFLPAYHMNKEYWITILLDGSVNKEKIKHLIDLSYDLTKNI